MKHSSKKKAIYLKKNLPYEFKISAFLFKMKFVSDFFFVSNILKLVFFSQNPVVKILTQFQ